jgi:tRNA threonylcarbamoyladenosine biosynthesis protein TsaE
MVLQVSIEKLADFAHRFWEAVGNAKVFAFHGPMGAGKTTTIAAICKAKGVLQTTSSPTFAIINEYRFTENEVAQTIFHIDLYRLKDDEEVVQTGVEDCIESGALCFVEWPEKAPYLFDETALHVIIEPINEKERAVKILTAQSYNAPSVAEQL